jgi:CRP-like cAMP-binding protein
VVFIVINLYWIVRLIIERRPVRLTPDEARLHQLAFPSLTLREARDLCAMGAWDDIAAGGSLVGHDRKGGHFSVILRGKADVIYRNTKVAELGEGQFCGDIDLRAESVGDIDVLMLTAARVMCWPRDRLKDFAAQRPDVALALQRSVGFQLQHLLAETIVKLVDATGATV